ncbi:glycosyltransferase family 4 protein [Flavilitoribacter nigricans]|uniref:Glycosyl transferase n=1 Tax=Flavilitoribacter nigricans (strain ATCC 23147 / DSM 23189 / NBRC 102662 / NCIMB 1420 / SS-2) TaxID=1122177 RepID=A0A2D0NCM9_FLAN2|nr:glycosyltransferase family 4 protein [Flavilitoribacter nigricans]PHN05523.1 glycosyl transferase [Flavilitoribacter nigricans DSM 23189 = NBRC 102662]
MKVAVLAPIAWRTPPRRYGPWEQVAANVADGMVAAGLDVTLFATADSFTDGKLQAIVPKGYAETPEADPKVLEYQHISFAMEQAGDFDLIHNHFDFMPLAYSRLISTPIITTIHGFSSPKILPVYQRFNDIGHYVSISGADRSPELDYIGTVYNGIDTDDFTFNAKPEDYLLYFGRIHPDKGTSEAVQIAQLSERRLIISGLIQDQDYFDRRIAPYLDDEQIMYVGNSGPEKRDELLSGALALLHPISFEEPFGLSVAEAMCCGTPVVAFKKGSMPELIENGKTGFLVKDVDAAVAVIEKIGGISRHYTAKRARKLFSRERMIEDYLQLYEEVLRARVLYT